MRVPEDHESKLSPNDPTVRVRSAGAAHDPDAEVPRITNRGVGMAPVVGRGVVVALLVWGISLLVITAGIAGETALWPLVLIIGTMAPILLVALHGRNQANALREREIREAMSVSQNDRAVEREVLETLKERGEMTAATAAMSTSLTVTAAAEVFERLAGKGHLEVQVREGSITYALREGERKALEGHTSGPPAVGGRRKASVETLIEPPAEPLSEREIEILNLLASGKTNREIAHERYIAQGTVKAHVANIYRKLDVHNRVEMIDRARALGLLD